VRCINLLLTVDITRRVVGHARVSVTKLIGCSSRTGVSSVEFMC